MPLLNEKEYREIVINGVNWNEICMLQYGDASASFKSFHDTHIYHLDEMSPFHEVTLKEFRLMTKPWITKEILAQEMPCSNKLRQKLTPQYCRPSTRNLNAYVIK